MDVILTYSKGNSNKFWGYTIDPNGLVTKKWGRIGTQGQTDRIEYPSYQTAVACMRRDQDAKMRKGYVVTESEEHNKQARIASTLGCQWKIQCIHYIGDEVDGGYRIVDDIIDGVVVELHNSWNKESVYISMISGQYKQYGKAEITDNIIKLKNKRMTNMNFVNGVKLTLNTLHNVVVDIYKRGRSLILTDVDEQMAAQTLKQTLQTPYMANCDDKVVDKIVKLGTRQLIL